MRKKGALKGFMPFLGAIFLYLYEVRVLKVAGGV
jgi:hypothetical protein